MNNLFSDSDLLNDEGDICSNSLYSNPNKLSEVDRIVTSGQRSFYLFLTFDFGVPDTGTQNETSLQFEFHHPNIIEMHKNLVNI